MLTGRCHVCGKEEEEEKALNQISRWGEGKKEEPIGDAPTTTTTYQELSGVGE